MLSQGPVPAVVHGLLEYAMGCLLIAAPFLFGFDATAATAAAVVIGLVLLAFTASSALPTGLVPSISVGVHVTVDLVLAALLVASPFVLGFTSDGPPTALFITLGVLQLLVTIGTRFPARVDADGDETAV
ncbi:MAG: SPW repeat domain-containing protein [Actinomycetes bacterium]